jgi:hypothetical protein
MTRERFFELLEAYGAAPERWPADLRTEAEEWLAQQDMDVLSALAKARALDDALSIHTVAAPDADLIRQILASAPPPATRKTLWHRSGWWLSAAGLVAVGAAGVAVGTRTFSLILAPLSTPVVASSFDRSFANTTFGDATIDDGSDP